MYVIRYLETGLTCWSLKDVNKIFLYREPTRISINVRYKSGDIEELMNSELYNNTDNIILFYKDWTDKLIKHWLHNNDCIELPSDEQLERIVDGYSTN